MCNRYPLELQYIGLLTTPPSLNPRYMYNRDGWSHLYNVYNRDGWSSCVSIGASVNWMVWSY